MTAIAGCTTPGWRHVVTMMPVAGLLSRESGIRPPYARIGHYSFVGRVLWGQIALPRHQWMDGCVLGVSGRLALSRAGFSVWLVWGEVPGDEASLWKILAVRGRYG
jgi:hypothetical protein